MNNRDWQRAEELFHTALELPAEERAAFLAEACPEDTAMRAEVESLIAAFENQPELMEQPALSLGLKVLSGDPTEETLAGKLIGPYKILRLLGEGGMGEVYVADDTWLDRKVAMKFL
jgi:serine/threonine protein kinase